MLCINSAVLVASRDLSNFLNRAGLYIFIGCAGVAVLLIIGKPKKASLMMEFVDLK